MGEEIIDIVNEKNEVVGAAPRKGIHNTKLMHRSIHMFLLNPDGRIWLEKRALTTDTFPGYYNSSAAGHISQGESYLEGAQREVVEELGIEGLNLKQVHMLKASEETSNEFVAFFVAESDAKPRVNEEATTSLHLYSVEQIDEMIASGGKFVPIFLRLYAWYKANMKK